MDFVSVYIYIVQTKPRVMILIPIQELVSVKVVESE